MNDLNQIKSLIKNEKCVFWVGAGISKDSGAPIAKELSNSIIYALCKNDSMMLKMVYSQQIGTINYDTNPELLTLPWKHAPLEIDVMQPSVKKSKKSHDFIRLETVLESLRQCLPNQLSFILDSFNQLRPNLLHYILASAIQKGHNVITTNWDRLIELAGFELSIDFETKIWNPKSNEIESEGKARLGSGILLKLHGSIEKSYSSINQKANVEPVTFIHQFTTGAPDSVRNILSLILKDKLIIFLGYSFSDYFDYEEILSNLTTFDSRAFVVHHCNKLIQKNSWTYLDERNYPLSLINCISKTGINAYTKNFLEWIWDNPNYKISPPKSKDDLIKNIIKVLSCCPEIEKKITLSWLFVLLGISKRAIHLFKYVDLKKTTNRLYWIYIITLSQAYYIEGKLKKAVLMIKDKLKKENVKSLPLDKLIYVLELLDRGCEIALAIPSRKHFNYFLNWAQDVYQIGLSKCSITDNFYITEFNIRWAHLGNNINAILRNRPKNFSKLIIKDLPSFPQNISRGFFILNILIYYKRSEALKNKNYHIVSWCYRAYIEMGNIDGAIGAIIDLASYLSNKNIQLSFELLKSGQKILTSNIGSIYAKVKLYAVLAAINLLNLRFDRLFLTILYWFRSLLLFDSFTALKFWTNRSYNFFKRTLISRFKRSTYTLSRK